MPRRVSNSSSVSSYGSSEPPKKPKGKVQKAAEGALSKMAGAAKGVGRSFGMTPKYMSSFKENLSKEQLREMATYFKKFEGTYSEKDLKKLIDLAFSVPPRGLKIGDLQNTQSYFDDVVMNLDKSGLSIPEFTKSYSAPFTEELSANERLNFMRAVLEDERVSSSELPQHHNISLISDALNDLGSYERHALLRVLSSARYTTLEGEAIADHLTPAIDELVAETFGIGGAEAVEKLVQRGLRGKDLQVKQDLFPSPTFGDSGASNPDRIQISLPNLRLYFREEL
jgi:hypothetical protein